MKKGMTILFKILAMVDLEKKQKTKKKKRRGPLMQRRLTPLFLSMVIQDTSPQTPPSQKNSLVQAFQTGFKYRNLVFLLLNTSHSAVVIKFHL